MKKIFLALPLLALLLTACNPSDIEGGSEWGAISADQLQVSATPVQVDGKNGNVLHVVNHSPVTTAWEADQLVENSTHNTFTEGDIYVTQLGQQTVRALATNTGGEPIVKEITVQIDTISYLTDEIKRRLCIGQENAPTYFGQGYDAAKIVFSQTVTEDGEKGNSITVTSNLNPALCTFHWGKSTMDTNIGQIVTYVLDEEQEFSVDFLDAAGNPKTVSLGKFTASVYSDFPEYITLLTGYHPVDAPVATKTWELLPENNWGNGGSNDKKASWWTTTVVDQGGSNGTLTFDFPNGILTKQLESEDNDDGDKSGAGAFTLDFTAENAETNVLFVLNTTEPGNIIHPIMINQSDYHPTRYEVTLLTETELVLRAQHTNDATWEGCFWHFRSVKQEE